MAWLGRDLADHLVQAVVTVLDHWEPQWPLHLCVWGAPNAVTTLNRAWWCLWITIWTAWGYRELDFTQEMEFCACCAIPKLGWALHFERVLQHSPRKTRFDGEKELISHPLEFKKFSFLCGCLCFFLITLNHPGTALPQLLLEICEGWAVN